MANLAASVGGMLGAGVRGIMDMADGLMHIGDTNAQEVLADGDEAIRPSPAGIPLDPDTDNPSVPTPLPVRPSQPRRTPSQPHSDTASTLSIPNSTTSNASNMSTSISNLSLRQSALIQTIDVPSGWIHLQNTYIDVAGSDRDRTVRSFGVRNLGEDEVEVEVGSDLGEQVVFWRGDDEKDMSSAASYSSTSSASNSTGTTSITLTIPAHSAASVYLAFIPSRNPSATPPIPQSPMLSDGGFTPRVLPSQRNTAVSSMPLDTSSAGDLDSLSAGSSQSVAGSFKASSNVGSRRSEPNYRASSLHGCITLRASVVTASTPRTDSASSAAMQMLNLPFFATVCKSHFTAALLDPATGLAANAHQSAGQMVIDFGSECVVGQECHRDILLVNRSEIELVWMTAVVNSRYKDQAWFSLRDLDSENVFGVDTSSQPVPLPSLSSRHLRLTLRIREPVIDFAFDFVISNVNQSGNLVTCRAIGSGQVENSDHSLKILSGTNLDFGQVVDGIWAKALITCKNAGDKAMDVKFSVQEGYEVCFRLAGVAGDDMDEDILLDPRSKRIAGQVQGQIPGQGQGQGHETHALLAAPARSSARSVERERGRMASSPLRSRAGSPTGSRHSEPFHPGLAGFPGMPGQGSQASQAQSGHRQYETDSQASSHASNPSHGATSSFFSGTSYRDPSLPPSRPLSRVASRSSSYRYAHTDATESDEDDREPSFLGGSDIAPSYGSSQPHLPSAYKPVGSVAPPPPPSNASSTGSQEVLYDRTIPNQIEELAMRPGTEYRIWVLYRPRRDTVNEPMTAGQLRTSTFKVYLDASTSRSVAASSNSGAGGKATAAGIGVAGVSRRTVHCSAESCTSLIRVSTFLPPSTTSARLTDANQTAAVAASGIVELDEYGVEHPSSTMSRTPRIDFGEVTVGANKSATIRIENLSHLSAKVEIAAISKVLSTNRNVVVIPPRESVEEKVEFFPRRINERYEKQVFVRNLLNRANDQLVEIRSRNVDVNNVTLHSHLYRILTPNGANFLDFGSVVINSPTVRTVQLENLTLAPLVLSLLASSIEDVEVYVKLAESTASDNNPSRQTAQGAGESSDVPTPRTARPAAYADEHDVLERVTSGGAGNGDLKERFMETLRELESGGPVPADSHKSKGAKGKVKGKADGTSSSGKGVHEVHHKSHLKGLIPHHARSSTNKATETDSTESKTSIATSVAVALRKGGRGRPVQLYGNAVVFKDRSLLDHHEHLDLAAGPPIAAHRVSPRSKKSALLDTIALEDKRQLSGQLPKSVKLDWAAGAKANGAVGAARKRRREKEGHVKERSRTKEEGKGKQSGDDSADNGASGADGKKEDGGMTESMVLTPKPAPRLPPTVKTPLPTLANIMSSLAPSISPTTGTRGPPTPDGGKSPALTGKRRESGLLKQEMFSAADVSKMSVDELLVALEQHDARRPTFNRTPSVAQAVNGGTTPGSAGTAESLTLEEEEQFVRRHIALRKELSNLISSGKLVPARQITIPPQTTRQMIVVLTPNGSIRPHVSTRPKRADSRLYINLVDFDRSYLSASTVNAGADDLPVRELIMRSACVRSTLEVQQTSINFGNCEKGEVRSKTIVIQNKSDSIGLFRLRTSGSIASGDLKLGLGRYGVISAFGRKEFTNFSFTPSLFGKYEETIVVENVLDSYQDQTVFVKANVRKQPAFTVDRTVLDFGQVALVAAEDVTEGKGATGQATDGEGQADVQVVDTFDFIPPSPASVVLTNVSKSERTFVITVELEKVPEVPNVTKSPSKPALSDANGTPAGGDKGEEATVTVVPFAQVHLSRDEAGGGTALSRAEEEEVEGMMQKLKIARRKKKADKVDKYETRLKELGVEVPKAAPEADGEVEGDDKDGEGEGEDVKDDKGEKKDRTDKKDKKAQEKETEEKASGSSSSISKPSSDLDTVASSATASAPASSSSLAAGPLPTQTNPSEPIIGTLDPCITSLTVTLPASQKTKILVELRQASFPPEDKPKSVERATSTSRTLKAVIKVHDRKNTDDMVNVAVLASLADKVDVEEKSSEAPGAASDPLHLALMRHCLDLTYKCEVSPTAFCVGSTLFLPSTSTHYTALKDRFPSFSPSGSSTSDAKSGSSRAVGLILGDGYSRQIPGNTHAEANALANFRTRHAQLIAAVPVSVAASTGDANGQPSIPPIEQVLKDVVCYATMEPCSVRTSGGPSCALELVRAGVKAVYLGVEEPPDFVACQGVQILQDGGVEVHHLRGLEDECLKAARRGRD